MAKPSIRTHPPVGGESVERITLSIASDDKRQLEQIAATMRVSIAWVIRDAVTKYLSVCPNDKKQNSKG